MKLVIDSNQLQSESLRRFLGASAENLAVLADYASMEAYKGDTLSSIYKSMGVVRDFPRQVVVLKGTRVVCGLRGRLSGLQRRMIDERQTAEFPVFLRHLELAKQGHRELERQLISLGRVATEQLDRMLEDARTTGEVFSEIGCDYTKEERKCIGIERPATKEFVAKTVRHVMMLAAMTFGNHPNVRSLPSYRELPNTFLFRAALCHLLLALDWVGKGGAGGASAAKLRNDFVDAIFAAYATYFDGLLTADGKAIRIHREARIWLATQFGCILPSGTHGANLERYS